MSRSGLLPRDASATLDRLEAQAYALKHVIGAASKLAARGRSTGWKRQLTRIIPEVWAIARELPSTSLRIGHSQVDGLAAMAAVLSHCDVARSCLDEGDSRGTLAAYAQAVDELLVILDTWRLIQRDDSITR